MSSVGRGGSGWAATTSGVLSGGASAVLLQPLDLVKTRVQQRPAGSSLGVAAVVRGVLDREGLAGLWRGLAPSLLRVVPGTGIYFSSLHALQTRLVPPSRKPNKAENFGLGFAARTAGTLAVLPATVLKVRTESSDFAFLGLGDALRQTVRRDGWRALWSGAAATVARDGPFSGLYLLLYRALLARALPNGDDGLGAKASRFACALLAAVSATAITHPADVVKTRVQLSPDHLPFTQALARLAREEGVRGLYQGFALRAARRSLLLALTWSLFHELNKLLTPNRFKAN